MDGNRRWAKQQGLFKVGRDGIEAAYRTVQFCIKQRIPYLSLFAFSVENFKRQADEVSHLFDLMVHEMCAKKDELIKNDIRICFVGDRTQFPVSIQQPCTDLEIATAAGSALQLNIMLCYGAQQEITQAAKSIACDVLAGSLSVDTINQETFAHYIGIDRTPPPDLIIRTGGVQRLSNFLLYQAAYSELYFLPCLWPALTEVDLQKAYDHFIACKRNFGT